MDPGLGLGPKSGSMLNRWHQSEGTDPRLVAGSGPGCVTTNRDRDTTYVGTGPDQLPLAKRWKRKWPILLGKIERDSHTPKNTSKPKKRGPNCFCFCFRFCFCSTPFFLTVKGIKLKEKPKRKKNESRSGHYLAGYRLGTRIRATLARILISGQDTDPRLRIRVRVLA